MNKNNYQPLISCHQNKTFLFPPAEQNTGRNQFPLAGEGLQRGGFDFSRAGNRPCSCPTRIEGTFLCANTAFNAKLLRRGHSLRVHCHVDSIHSLPIRETGQD